MVIPFYYFLNFVHLDMFRPCLKFFRHSNASHCVLSRKFSPSQVKNAKEFPERLPTIRETAQRLGYVRGLPITYTVFITSLVCCVSDL